MLVRRFVVLAVVAVAAASCGSSPDAPPPIPSITVVAGAGAADSISTVLVQGLVVRVTGTKGTPEEGLAVNFEAQALPACVYDRSVRVCTRVLLAPAVDGTWGGTASATTDADGRAVVRVAMGPAAGAAAVSITVPLYGLSDSAHYTVQPGAPATVMVLPRDTVLEIGASYTLRGGVADRLGNTRTEGVTFTPTSSAARVDGSTVTAISSGRVYVRLSAAIAGSPVLDSVGLTVVPGGRVAVAESYASGLVLKSAAGGAPRTVLTTPAAEPGWSPAGNRIVYLGASGLAITDTVGNSTALPTTGVAGAAWPQYSADGVWIYFQGTSTNDTQIFRIHPDGSGLQALQGSQPGDQGGTPSPSPDGTRVAYTNGPLFVKTLATGHVDKLADWATACRWSPDGNWIAFISTSGGGIGLVHPDGTGGRMVPASIYSGGITWAPDSRWILLGSYGSMSLVEVATGKLLPLNGVTGLYPAWQP